MAAQDRAGTIMGARAVAAVTPILCGLLGVFIANLPVSLLGGLLPSPLLGLIPIYFWCLVRPDIMTPGWAFIIGLLEDVLSGGPPGIWTLGFVLSYGVVDRQRDAFAGLSGVGAVLGFATCALVTCLAAYGTVTIYYWHFPPIAPLMGEFVMTVLFYIPGGYLVGAIHRRLVGPLRSDF